MQFKVGDVGGEEDRVLQSEGEHLEEVAWLLVGSDMKDISNNKAR